MTHRIVVNVETGVTSIVEYTAEEHADAWALQLQSVMEEAEAKWLGEIPPLAEAKVGNSWDQAK